MFVAIDEQNNRVMADKAIKGNKYFCPICYGEVRLKADREECLNATHFAHVCLENCDEFSSDMSEWHREWQMLFPERNREYILSYENEKHRADIVCYRTVIEFQHSSISETEFWKRNDFYTAAGYRVVWIFDVIDVYNDDRMTCVDEWDNKYGKGGTYQWKHPWRFLGGFLPQNEKNIDIFFQIVPIGDDPKSEEAVCCMERVTWVNPNYKTVWGSFRTSYEVTNYSELISWLKKRWLREKGAGK